MINVFEPRLSVKDKISVLKTLNKNNISGTSPTVNEFEKACAEKFGRKYGIGFHFRLKREVQSPSVGLMDALR